jgi:ubiquitin carboxyl-terminal hydrolase 5/13
MDDLDAPLDTTAAPSEELGGSAQYRLRAFISHMGSSTACGHYVCHVTEATDSQWILFNDNKVAVSKNPPKHLGYLYLYEQI